MLIFRWLVFALLFGAGVLFALYAATGQQRYKRFGFALFKWTVIAGVFFFAVILIDQLL